MTSKSVGGSSAGASSLAGPISPAVSGTPVTPVPARVPDEPAINQEHLQQVSN